MERGPTLTGGTGRLAPSTFERRAALRVARHLGDRVRLAHVQVGIVERRDLAGVVQERVAVARGGGEAELVLLVGHGVAVGVDVQLVQHVVAELVEVRSAGGLSNGLTLATSVSVPGVVRAHERVDVREIGDRIFGDQRCLPVAGGVGRADEADERAPRSARAPGAPGGRACPWSSWMVSSRWADGSACLVLVLDTPPGGPTRRSHRAAGAGPPGAAATTGRASPPVSAVPARRPPATCRRSAPRAPRAARARRRARPARSGWRRRRRRGRPPAGRGRRRAVRARRP